MLALMLPSMQRLALVVPALWLIVSFAPGCAARAPIAGEATCEDPYLRNLLGTWTIDREIRGERVTNSMEATPILGGKFVRLHMRSTTPGRPYEAVVTVGRKGSTDEYVAYWCDSFGAEYSEAGRGTRVGGRIEFLFAYPSGPFHNTWTYDESSDQWSFVGESGGPDGSRTPFARDTVRRTRAGRGG